MEVNNQSIVAIEYELTDHKSGRLLEKTPDNKLMKFKFGIGELLSMFESNIIGLKAGDSFDFVIPASEAYGPVDPYGIFDIPIDTFMEDGKLDEKMIKVGNKIPLTDNKGNKHIGVIIKVLAEAVTMDFNHPLAGTDLRFKGKVTEVFE